MQVNKISNSNNSFGRLYLSSEIQEKLSNGAPQKFIRQVDSITNLIRQNNLHRKKYVDIILSCDKYGLKGIISSKQEGIPMNPDAFMSINNPKKDIKEITNWVNSWNYSYSPKGLAEHDNLMEIIEKAIKELYSKS